MNTVAIIIPCYNEELRLQQDKFLHYARINPGKDIWFVNDGSSDGTSALLCRIAERSAGNIKVHNLPENKGKAEAIRQAMNFLFTLNQYHYIGFIDADLSAPLEELNPLYQLIVERRLKIVAGARVMLIGTVIHRSALRHYLGRIFATYYDSLLQLRNYDTQCGVKIFETDFAQKLFDKPFVSDWFFDIEFFLRARKMLGAEEYYRQIAEEPLKEWKEVKGSKLKMTDFLKAPFEVLKIYRKYK